MKIYPVNNYNYKLKTTPFKGDIVYLNPTFYNPRKELTHMDELCKYFYDEKDIMVNNHIRYMNTKLPPVMNYKKSPSPDISYYLSDNPLRFPWEIQIFADTEHDFQAIAATVGHYLADNDISFDMLSDVKSVNSNNLDPYTRGKVMTIYPASKENFNQIAQDINFIINYNRLNTQYSKIKGSRPLDNTGRIFYRYGMKIGFFKDSTFDLSDLDNFDRYNLYREPIRDSYMASDMTSKDDPWR